MVKSVGSSWPLTSAETLENESARRKHTREIADWQKFIGLVFKVLKSTAALKPQLTLFSLTSKIKHIAVKTCVSFTHALLRHPAGPKLMTTQQSLNKHMEPLHSAKT
jgi:hypothetical protein